MPPQLSCCLAYIGPETILPIGSAIAAVGGVAMMFWNSLRRAFSLCFRKAEGTGAGETSSE